jgi:hypothetical protein
VQSELHAVVGTVGSKHRKPIHTSCNSTADFAKLQARPGDSGRKNA